jgi:hypothetical protein
MKIQLSCLDCSVQRTTQGWLFADLRDDGLYDVRCQLGHRRIVGLGNLKFELLFESGALAILDGYNLEAVASFSAALERFLEFYITVVSLKYDVSIEQLDQSWKLVSSQSERQLGAFLLLYLVENKRAASYIDQKKVEFRNKVIHKGYVPTQNEALDYGERVFNFVGGIFKELKNTSEDFVASAIAVDHRRKIKKMPKSQSKYMTTQLTMMNATSVDSAFATLFRESLSALRRQYKKR